jgi:hypothetical protein
MYVSVVKAERSVTKENDRTLTNNSAHLFFGSQAWIPGNQPTQMLSVVELESKSIGRAIEASMERIWFSFRVEIL